MCGKIGSILTGAKGQSYNNEQFFRANKFMVTEHEKYKAMGDHFDPENDQGVETSQSWFDLGFRSGTGGTAICAARPYDQLMSRIPFTEFGLRRGNHVT